MSVPFWLTLIRIPLPHFPRRPAQALRVGGEQVVADEPHPVAEPRGEVGPA